VELLFQGSKSPLSVRKHGKVSIAKAPFTNSLKAASGEAKQAQCQSKQAQYETKQAKCEPTVAFGKAKLPVAASGEASKTVQQSTSASGDWDFTCTQNIEFQNF